MFLIKIAFRGLGKLLGIARNPWIMESAQKQDGYSIHIKESAKFETQGYKKKDEKKKRKQSYQTV